MGHTESNYTMIVSLLYIFSLFLAKINISLFQEKNRIPTDCFDCPPSFNNSVLQRVSSSNNTLKLVKQSFHWSSRATFA